MNNCVNKLNNMLIDSPSKEVGLADGMMGRCIYLFWLSRVENNKIIKSEAELLIDRIVNKINEIDAVDIKTGISGIGLGFDYLIKQKFISGNVNDVLKPIDNVIFKNLDIPKNYELHSPLTVVQLLYYLGIRIGQMNSKTEASLLFKGLAIKTLNNLYEKIDITQLDEPVFYKIDYLLPMYIYTLSKLYALDFYNSRILKILEELSPRILTILPYFHCNRMYLLWGLDSIFKQVEIAGWRNHINTLKKECNIETILNYEFKSNKIYFFDGVASIYFFFRELKHYFSIDEFFMYNQLFCKKMIDSDIWSSLDNDPLYFKKHNGLLKGYCSIIILLNTEL